MKKSITLLLISISILFSITGYAIAQAGTKTDSQLTKVVVSEFRFITWMPVYIAYANNFFKDEGLDVQFMYYKDGPIAFLGMHAGDSQFCLLSQEPVLTAQIQGLQSSLIGTVFKTRLYGLAAGANITDISQLKGKSIFAGMPGSAPYSFISNILNQNGLDPEKDVTFVTMDYGASMAALGLGAISASYFSSDNLPELKNIQHNVLVYTENDKDSRSYLKADIFPAEIVVTTKKFAQEHPETVQKFVNAMVKGAQWIGAHTSSEVAEQVTDLFDSMTMEELTEKIELSKNSFTKDCYISEEGQKAVENFCVATHVITKSIPYDDIVDMRFVNKALNR
ncbi:MAG: ABC transporter substrate-binding protein [Desulfobacter sp.]|nr:MAG: ABC transporter substrate-binding protein [Desulfobacter sp.]